MKDETNYKTWKEWAIKQTFESERLFERLDDLETENEKIKEENKKYVEKFDALKESFIRLETRISTVVAVGIFIFTVIELIFEVIVK